MTQLPPTPMLNKVDDPVNVLKRQKLSSHAATIFTAPYCNLTMECAKSAPPF